MVRSRTRTKFVDPIPANVVPKTHIAIVFDCSDSMSNCWNEALQAFNNQMNIIRQDGKDQQATVTFIPFSNNARTKFVGVAPNQVENLTPYNLQRSGMTALFDGVGLAVETLQGLPDAHDPNVSFLVITITDGGENASHKYGLPNGLYGMSYGKQNIGQILLDTQKTDRWTYVFQVPPGAKRQFVAMGIPDDNVREWTNDRVGAIATDVATQSGLTQFFDSRAKGQRSVTKFYHETDMSKVKPEEIKKKLDDLSDEYKLYEVTKEATVQEFVEEKTKKPYVIGSAFYLLMKKEKVQAKKEVLIMEKKKKAVWGGPEARKLIGLKPGVETIVEPLNHANYDIFVQSTSVNRKLPRGTKLLVNTQMTKGLDPTWNHLAVK